MSCVIGPPDSAIVLASCGVRSSLIACQVWPPSVVFHTRCDEVYSTFGSIGEKMMGNVHCQRSFTALDGSPEKKRGYAPTSLSSDVRRFSRVMNAPLFARA